jgi:hypothetical protein
MPGERTPASTHGLRRRGHRVLTAAAGTSGAADKDLRAAQPNISLAWIGERMPMHRDTGREHYLEAFRRAGLK